MRSSISIYKGQLEAQQRNVRRELAIASRQANLQRTANARLKTQQQAALAAASVRAESDQLLQRTTRNGMADILPASEAVLINLAGQCAQQIECIFPDPQARNWFNLFKMVDTNQTGRICFYEFSQMVRNLLKISERELSDHDLKAIWRALDGNFDGNITAGEFGAFMRKATVNEGGLTWRERLHNQRKLEVEEERQLRLTLNTASRRRFEEDNRNRLERAQTARHHQSDGASSAMLSVMSSKRRIADNVRRATNQLLQRDVASSMAGVTPAREELVRDLAEKCNAALLDIFADPQSRNWFNLFRIVDTNHTGQICFYEFFHMARDLLKMGRGAYSDDELKSIWRAIDFDCSGHITAGEFGGFMRKCNKEEELTWRERQRMNALRSRQELEEKREAHIQGVVMPMLAQEAKALETRRQRLLDHLHSDTSSSKFVAKAEPRVCLLENNPSHFLSSELRFARG